MKPVVDRLEQDLDGQAAVLRLDFMSEVGRETASRYGVKVVPTLLVFDQRGRVVLRQTGVFDPGAVRAKVAALRERQLPETATTVPGR